MSPTPTTNTWRCAVIQTVYLKDVEIWLYDNWTYGFAGTIPTGTLRRALEAYASNQMDIPLEDYLYKVLGKL
jgi:hypothetical protein